MKNCRFCLKSNKELDIQLTLLSAKCCSYVELILPELDLNLTESPRICNLCLTNLENAYNFKTRCLESEKHLHSIKNETECKEESDYEILVYENVFDEIEYTSDKNQIGEIIFENSFDDEEKNQIELGEYEIVSYEETRNVDVIKNESLVEINRNTKKAKRSKYDYEKCYKCKVCGNKYSAECLLQRHKFSVNLKTINVCGVCDKEYQDERELLLHMNTHRTNSKSNSVNGKSSGRVRNLKRHIA